MIVLFTDFGYNGPYVGQMKSVLAQLCSDVPIIDLMHDAPAFNPRSSAYLLAALVQGFPRGTVFLCVVDPGVGKQDRLPCIVDIDGWWFVGPQNGLFNALIQQSEQAKAWSIKWLPKQLSASFHGRDLFAPVAALLAQNEMPEVEALSMADVLMKDWPDDLNEVIYFDNYGNAVTGYRVQSVDKSAELQVGEESLRYARTFSEVEPGNAFWYENSMGLVEIAVNSGSAHSRLNLTIGTTFTLG